MITSSFNNIRYIFEKTSDINQNLNLRETRSTPILNKSNDYKVAVESFIFSKYNLVPDILEYRFYTYSIPVLDSNISGQQNLTKRLLFTYQLDNADRSSLFITFRADNYYWYDLLSSDALYTMDLYATQVNKNGVETPLVFYDLHHFSMTLLFNKI